MTGTSDGIVNTIVAPDFVYWLETRHDAYEKKRVLSESVTVK
jgi:hypothetical protein